MLKIIYAISILISFLLVGCNVMGDQDSFNDEFFQTPYKYDKVFYQTGVTTDIGDVGIGYTFKFDIDIQNDSDEMISLNEVKPPDGAFSYESGAGYPGSNGDCGSSLPSYSSCILRLEVTIGSQVAVESSIEIEYYFNSNPDEVFTLKTKLKAQGVDKAVLKYQRYYDDWKYDFYQMVVGSNVTTRAIWVTNASNIDALDLQPTMSNFSIFDYNGTFPGSGGTCPGVGGTLAAATSCSIDFEFTPLAVQKYEGSIGIRYDQSNGEGYTTKSILVEGEGVGPAVISVSPSSYNFGTHSADVAHTFTATNIGSSMANGTFISVNSGVTAYNISMNNCPTSATSGLNPNDTCTFEITYEGSSNAPGTWSGVIHFDYNDGQTTQTTTVNTQGTNP